MAAKVNPDLQKERDVATFDPIQVTYLLDGSQEKTQRRKKIEKLAFSDAGFKGPDVRFLSREEVYMEGARKAAYWVMRMKELGITDPMDQIMYKFNAIRHSCALDMHAVAFLPPLLTQASPEQQEALLSPAMDYGVIGCYIQTELGHGSSLRRIETTATYDPETQEFVVNTPSLTATKWWVGNMGKAATHGILMAQLVTKGKHHGVHPFLMRLRGEHTHVPLPGIEIGDIGPKFGFAGNDNGFARFDHVRIPRDALMAKTGQVLEDGTYVPPKNAKAAYGGMVFIRSRLVLDAGHGLAKAATIAIRYSCVRRQSELKPGAPEPQILDYQTQQYKVLPEMARAYAFWFAGHRVAATYDSTLKEIMDGNTLRLGELHALTAGLKAYCTLNAAIGTEKCRLACGGHGYSLSSGLPDLYQGIVAGATAEGEVTILLLQTARFLVKAAATAASGRELPGSAAYLGQPPSCKNPSTLDLQAQICAYECRARGLVKQAASRIQGLVKKGHPEWEAWNMSGVALTKAATAHCELFLASTLASVCREQSLSSEAQRVMMQVAELYALHGIMEAPGDFIRYTDWMGGKLEECKERMLESLASLRRNAVTLVDAFDFHDDALNSVLGRYDGNVYENMYKWAKESPLNKTEVHESYNKYMKPFKDAMSKL